MWFYIWIFLLLLADQVSKFLIRLYFDIGESVAIWEGVLHFTRYENSGIAFGMLPGYGRYFVPIALLIAVLAFYCKGKGYIQGRLEEAGAAFFVAGSLGNAVDRLLFNQVTDFIDFQFHNGILNLADYFINFGFVLLLIHLVLSYRKPSFMDLRRPPAGR